MVLMWNHLHGVANPGISTTIYKAGLALSRQISHFVDPHRLVISAVAT